MDWTAIISGAAGALAIQLLNLMELKNIAKDKRPDFTDFFNWLPFIIAPLAGGFVCWAYSASGYNIKPIIGVQLGVSAPLIFRAMATAIPKGYEPLPPGA
jgi:bacteriorhodopsin